MPMEIEKSKVYNAGISLTMDSYPFVFMSDLQNRTNLPQELLSEVLSELISDNKVIEYSINVFAFKQLYGKTCPTHGAIVNTKNAPCYKCNCERIYNELKGDDQW